MTHQRLHATIAALAVAGAMVAVGCADRKTTVRTETETVTRPRIVEEQTVVNPPTQEETTVIRRERTQQVQ